MEAFLRAVDQTFPVPLSQKQDLTAYAGKLCDKATLCAAFADGKIVSLVAGYTENLPDEWAYIAIVATLPEARRKGLAAQLVTEFIGICRAKHIKAVHLYARSENIGAMKLYTSLGFQPLHLAYEPRKEDAHLIYYLEDF